MVGESEVPVYLQLPCMSGGDWDADGVDLCVGVAPSGRPAVGDVGSSGRREEGAQALCHDFFMGVSGEMEGDVAVPAEVDRLCGPPCVRWDLFECVEDLVSGVGWDVDVAYDECVLCGRWA